MELTIVLTPDEYAAFCQLAQKELREPAAMAKWCCLEAIETWAEVDAQRKRQEQMTEMMLGHLRHQSHE